MPAGRLPHKRFHGGAGRSHAVPVASVELCDLCDAGIGLSMGLTPVPEEEEEEEEEGESRNGQGPLVRGR
jgi:hypothetical protein